MHRTKVSVSFGPLLLSILLVASIISTPLRARAQAQAADVAVRLMDAIDSSKDPAGKQYHALVTKAVEADNGVMIPQGAAAMVTLVNSGSGWTTQLASVTINGQPVAVASGPASVTSAAQSAASAAVNSVSSMVRGFGHHVSAPQGVAAVAMGQRVVLPSGTMLNFVLSQPATSGARPPAPTVAVTSAPTVPQPTQSSVAPVASAGQHWWMCQYQDKKDPGKPALGSLMYYAVLPSSDSFPNDHGKHFNAYVQQNYQIMDPNSAGKGFCRRTSDDGAARATSIEMFQKQWRSSNIEPIQVNFANTPAQDAAIDAKLARGAQQQAAPVVNSKECAFHATCGTALAPKPD